jgi:hypothetical protein
MGLMVVRYTPLQKWSRRERKLNPNGYVLVWAPEHPKSFDGGWYYEHRLVAERYYNRILPSWVTVHHINENKQDNFHENLIACTRLEHDRAA